MASKKESEKVKVNKAALSYGLIAYTSAAVTTLALLVGLMVGKEENYKPEPQQTRLECLRQTREIEKCPTATTDPYTLR